MDALQKTSIFNQSLVPKQSTIVIGLSGGPDSVFLLHKLVEIRQEWGLTLIAGHLDHGWRESSANDALFCKKLCEQLQVPLVSAKASELDHGFMYEGSHEELGRKIRRFFFAKVMNDHQAPYLTLGHNKDDQYETFFINLIRGTTITGLCGMKEKEQFFNGHLIRPLLGMEKQEILTALTKQNFSYCIDPTNNSDAFLRNRIRKNLMPALRSCDERAADNLSRAIVSLQETEQFLAQATKEALEKVIYATEVIPTKHGPSHFVEGDGLSKFERTSPPAIEATRLSVGGPGYEVLPTSLNLKLFFALHSYLQKRVLKEWLTKTTGSCRSSEAYLNELLRFLSSPRGGSHQISPHWLLVKKQNIVSLQRL